MKNSQNNFEENRQTWTSRTAVKTSQIVIRELKQTSRPMERGLEMDAYISDNLIFDKGALMVNFMCQAGRNTGYQDI